ncbi:MAG: hypothetical protein M5R36_27515 [Deltaproteobacteria bacterium]|nr:hypothetical protein [Deltaproteobacteria bacterium]
MHIEYICPPNDPDYSMLRADHLEPGKNGWVQLDVPRTDGQCLLACQPSTKSDWWDAKEQKVIDNPAAIKLFEKFWRKWKKHFTYPTIVKNTKIGASALYRDIGYSQGAAEWYRNGGRIVPRGSSQYHI